MRPDHCTDEHLGFITKEWESTGQIFTTIIPLSQQFDLTTEQAIQTLDYWLRAQTLKEIKDNESKSETKQSK